MSGVAQKFWFTIVPLLTGLAGVGLLVLAALFPAQLFAVDSVGYIATAAVALVSLGVVVWQLATPSGDGGQSADRPSR